MADITDRLRDRASATQSPFTIGLLGEAAGEIEALRAKVTDLTTALRRAEADHNRTIEQRDHWEDVIGRAAEALGCDEEWSSAHDHGACLLEATERAAAEPGVLDALRARARVGVGVLEHTCSRAESEVRQVLGKALGYPWYKDDPKNFPGSTEADGVCTGDHVAASLADEAADRIKGLDWVAMVREVHMETVPEILRDTPGIPKGSLYANYGIGFIREEVKELERACYDGNLVEMVDALADIVYVSIRASLMLGVDLRPVMREVHRAMKTKYEGGLLKRVDGKVLKGPNYVPPDIAAVLDAQKGGAFD